MVFEKETVIHIPQKKRSMHWPNAGKESIVGILKNLLLIIAYFFSISFNNSRRRKECEAYGAVVYFDVV